MPSGGPNAEASPPPCDPSDPNYPDCEGFNEPPVSVHGGPYSGQVAQNIQFNGSSSYDIDGYINQYYWTFGDGTTSSSANPRKVMQQRGRTT
ncbi:MAG: PKD domain-containing protein [Pyrinomonadaceae bacterium]